MLCAKCKRVKPLEGDSWCVGCSGWEAIGIELCATWHNQALRTVAGALVAQTITSIRALRQVSSSLKSAEDSRAATSTPSRSQVPRREAEEADPPRGERATSHRGVKDEEPSSEYETTEEEEEAPATSAKADPTKRPPEPPHPPKGWVEREPIERANKKRKDREERQPLRRKTERGRRSGRKHQALYRTLDKPELRVHRRKPAAYWDSQASFAGVETPDKDHHDDRGRK